MKLSLRNLPFGQWENEKGRGERKGKGNEREKKEIKKKKFKKNFEANASKLSIWEMGE